MRAVSVLVLVVFASTARAQAIPVFANGQGVSCSTCHTTFPGMTRYGMMVMMTNFQILKRHLQNQALPVAARLYITSMLANNGQPASTTVSDLSLLSGGFMGSNFTYYAEQHIIDSGQIGQTEQLWLSWNGLFGGTNSFQVGKFHTPFPFMPAHAWSIGDYLLATQTTGQNDFNPNDARWGVAFNGMSNEFMYNLAYLTGSGPVGDGLNYNGSANPKTMDFNVSYGGMSHPFSVGLVGIAGTAPLHDAANMFDGYDGFTREGLYLGYQTNAWHFQTMYYHGYDAHPDVDLFNVPLNGYFFEAERDFGWRNHILARYDVASSDTLNQHFVLDLSHNILPNMAVIGELLTAPAQHPQISLQLAVAGPYRSGQRFLWKNDPGQPVGTIAPASTTIAAAAPALGNANNGAQLVQANGCTGCHGATLQGALGPALYGVEKRRSQAQIENAIKHPRKPMPDFGFSDTQIADIVAYLTGLDGGSGVEARPVVSFEPSPPKDGSTISVLFPGEPPKHVVALPVMQMGASSMSSSAVTLTASPDNPKLFTGKLAFSMGGPWVITIQYDGESMTVPIDVGGR